MSDDDETRARLADIRERHMHWKRYFDNEYLGSWDLGQGDHAVVIERVQQGELPVRGTSRKERKPVVFFVGKKKPMILNTTNAKSIAAMYGNDTAAWTGKSIAIYATVTSFGGEEVDCVRVRPTPPKPRRPKDAPPELPPKSETEEETPDATH